MASRLMSLDPYVDGKSVEVFRNVPIYQYSYVYDFEKVSFHQEIPLVKWVQKNWTSVFVLSAVYVAFIFLGQRYMRSRPPFQLRLPLAIWSTSLALFSIMAAYRTIPEMVDQLSNYGLYHSVCCPTYFYGVSGFWSILFVLSKPVELGDTVFIVLRKQKLIFLHWYHHVTVMLYVWQSYSEHTAAGRWFYVINYSVHACMYSYYALRAWQIKTPRWVNIGITALQIIQMVIGTSLYFYIWRIRTDGHFCQMTDNNAFYGFVMYLSYFALFSHFFYNTYIKKSPHPPIQRTVRKEEESHKSSRKSSSLMNKGNVAEVLRTVAEIERSGFVKKDD